MIFDQFCGLVERHFPDLRRLIETARLFHFPGRAHEVLPRTQENVEYFLENFFLPFRCVAVEDTASVVILLDPIPETRGLTGITRAFVECLPLGLSMDDFSDKSRLDDKAMATSQKIIEKYGQTWQVSAGLFSYCGFDNNMWHTGGTVARVALASMKKILHQEMGPEAGKTSKGTLGNVATAFEELMYFNSPDRFILEETPLGALQKKGKGAARAKIPRSHDRPVYTILKPTEIRQKLNLPIERTGTHASPVPHDRRAHPRTLRSEKFKNKKGQTIIIPATWVGVNEVTRGNKRYKILLDR